MLMRIFNYHRHKLPVILLFITFFLVSCGGGPDGKSICVWPFCPPGVSEYPIPGTLAGIDADSASKPVPTVTYVEYSFSKNVYPQVQIPVGGEETPQLDRNVAPTVYWNEYRGFKFESPTGPSEKTHEVLLYTDKWKKEETDYLTFGVWLTKPKQTTDEHPVVAFAIGGNSFTKNLSSLTGTATYEGPAVGIYGSRASDSETGEAGSFTAKATLWADFRDDSVNGEVTDFIKKRGGRLGALKVTLISDVKNGGADFGGNTRISTGEDAVLMTEGQWNGKFYGKKLSGHPGSVAGTFNAKTGDLKDKAKVFVSIVGAFGAKKMP